MQEVFSGGGRKADRRALDENENRATRARHNPTRATKKYPPSTQTGHAQLARKPLDGLQLDAGQAQTKLRSNARKPLDLEPLDHENRSTTKTDRRSALLAGQALAGSRKQIAAQSRKQTGTPPVMPRHSRGHGSARLPSCPALSTKRFRLPCPMQCPAMTLRHAAPDTCPALAHAFPCPSAGGGNTFRLSFSTFPHAPMPCPFRLNAAFAFPGDIGQITAMPLVVSGSKANGACPRHLPRLPPWPALPPYPAPAPHALPLCPRPHAPHSGHSHRSPPEREARARP